MAGIANVSNFCGARVAHTYYCPDTYKLYENLQIMFPTHERKTIREAVYQENKYPHYIAEGTLYIHECTQKAHKLDQAETLPKAKQYLTAVVKSLTQKSTTEAEIEQKVAEVIEQMKE